LAGVNIPRRPPPIALGIGVDGGGLRVVVHDNGVDVFEHVLTLFRVMDGVLDPIDREHPRVLDLSYGHSL
jgi:hypothetical protein